MGNHAALIRAENAGKPVTRRGRNFIEFDLGGGVIRHVATINPLHYSATLDQEIDTTWVADTGAWQWKLVANDFQVHARNYLNSGDLIQWLDTRSGESVIVDPQSINWVDNATDSRQQISTKQAVLGVPNDAEMLWTNGYGTGRHFRYTAHPRRLIKHVIIDSLASLPAPTVSNPYFEIEFIIKKSSGVTLYIDGQPWDNSTKVTTANRIEYRLADGTVAWYVPTPTATDSSLEGNPCPGILQVRRQGANRFCTVRFPKAWIDAAVFPIYVDDTFYDGYGQAVNTAQDTHTRENASSLNFGATNAFYAKGTAANRRYGLILFDLASIPDDATVNSANLYLYNQQSNIYAIDVTLHSILSANSGWVEGSQDAVNEVGASDWDYKTDGSLRWAGDVGSNGGTDAGCSVSATDYNATAMGSFTKAASEAVGVEHNISLTTSYITAWLTANYGMVMKTTDTSAGTAAMCSSDHATTGYRPLLVVDYTPTGGRTTRNTDPRPLGIFSGISRKVNTS